MGKSVPGPMDVHEMAAYAGAEKAIVDSIGMTYAVLERYEHPAASISGGADSDVVLDLCSRLDKERKLRYIWFDTGLEYRATKEHLAELEKRYGVTIERVLAIKSIPTCCHEYGLPFMSKFASAQIEKLQRNGFQWEDEPFEALLQRYPGCPSALKWWCDRYGKREWNIGNIRHLKEFLIREPPEFPISAKCCEWAKKRPALAWARENGADVQILGLRKSEGGVRAATKHCLTSGAVDLFRPIFWYTDADRAKYEKLFGIVHSDCYTVYGLTRTGCVGCPFDRTLASDMEAVERHEPGLYRAARNVFGRTWGYTRRFRRFAGQTRASALREKIRDL